jgi:hypothetical protein
VWGSINGQTGWFQFSGIRRNDQTVNYVLDIQANTVINGVLLVNGSIGTVEIANGAVTAAKVTTGELITQTAQIKDLTVDHLTIKNQAVSKNVTQNVTSSGTGTVISQFRAGSRLSIIATCTGWQGGSLPTLQAATNSKFTIKADGAIIAECLLNYHTVSDSGGTYAVLTSTTLQGSYTVPGGASTGDIVSVTIQAINSLGPVDMRILVVELTR